MRGVGLCLRLPAPRTAVVTAWLTAVSSLALITLTVTPAAAAVTVYVSPAEQQQSRLSTYPTTVSSAERSFFSGEQVDVLLDGRFVATVTAPRTACRAEPCSKVSYVADPAELTCGRHFFELRSQRSADRSGRSGYRTLCPYVQPSPPVFTLEGARTVSFTFGEFDPNVDPPRHSYRLTVTPPVGNPTVSTGFLDYEGTGEDAAQITTCGVHTVVVEQTSGGRPLPTATGRFVALCPAVVLDPATVPVTALPRDVAVTGSGFVPQWKYEVFFDGRSIGGGDADDDGRFTLPLTAADLRCGQGYPVRAVQHMPQMQHYRGVSDPFEVVAEATLRVSCERKPPGPVVDVVPAVTADGYTVLIRGKGFSAASEVELRWLLPGGRPGMGTCRTSTNGQGSFERLCLVVPGDQLGQREAVAVDVAGLTAADSVEVVKRTVQPSRRGLVMRR